MYRFCASTIFQVSFLVGSIDALTTTKINYLPNGQIGGYELIINNTDDGLKRFNYENPNKPGILPSRKNILPYPPPSGKLNENQISYQTFRKNNPQPLHNYESSFTRVDQRKVGEDVLVSIHNVLTKKTHRDPKYSVSSLLMLPSLRYKNGAAEPVSLKLAQIGPYAALLVPVEKQVASENPVVPDLSKTIKSFVELENYQPPMRRNSEKYAYPRYPDSGRYPPSSADSLSQTDRSDQNFGSTQLSQSKSTYNEGIFGKPDHSNDPELNLGLPVDLSKDFAIHLTDIGANIYNPPSGVLEHSYKDETKYEEREIVSWDRKTADFQAHPQDPGSSGHPSVTNLKQEQASGGLKYDKTGTTGTAFDIRLGSATNEALGSSSEPKKYFDHTKPHFELREGELPLDLLKTFPTEAPLVHSTSHQPNPFPAINPETLVNGLSGVVQPATAATPAAGTSSTHHDDPEQSTEFALFKQVSQHGADILTQDQANPNPTSSVAWHLSSNRQDRKYFDHSKPLPDIRSSFLDATAGTISIPADTQVRKLRPGGDRYEIAGMSTPGSDNLPNAYSAKTLTSIGVVGESTSTPKSSGSFSLTNLQSLGKSDGHPKSIDPSVGVQQYGGNIDPADSSTGIQAVSPPLIGSDQKLFDHSIPASYESGNHQSSIPNLDSSNLGPGKFSVKSFPERFPIENTSVGQDIALEFQKFSSSTEASEVNYGSSTASSISGEEIAEQLESAGKPLSLTQFDKDMGSFASWPSTEPITREKSDELAFSEIPAGRTEVGNKFIIRVPSLPENGDTVTDDPRLPSFREKIQNPGTPPTLEQKQHTPGPHIGSLLETLDGILAIRST
ncbi:Hypothetical protein NTJ_06214 [Nesidiocoris tenuis]|uniref:Uncharacterized protein n=1 Tax=Nesidiocoris tenuis TaxID=355587 RepID=A0ABN7AR62_9HEMI|nr:Hypothetical protein NTJ_06214 [Nesidiocoris tenuis]